MAASERKPGYSQLSTWGYFLSDEKSRHQGLQRLEDDGSCYCLRNHVALPLGRREKEKGQRLHQEGNHYGLCFCHVVLHTVLSPLWLECCGEKVLECWLGQAFNIVCYRGQSTLMVNFDSLTSSPVHTWPHLLSKSPILKCFWLWPRQYLICARKRSPVPSAALGSGRSLGGAMMCTGPCPPPGLCHGRLTVTKEELERSHQLALHPPP